METYTLRPRTAPSPSSYRIDYAGELNPAQYEAATTLEGPILVIAGAGSGKTRTLVYRVARLVESGVNPGQILLLTFTRKAAEEMLRRAAVLVGASCERVAGGTFHSFANSVLRRNARRIGFEPNFTILDRSDSEDAINLLRAHEISDAVESQLQAAFPHAEIMIHEDPAGIEERVAFPPRTATRS